jgi:hypothetical protein
MPQIWAPYSIAGLTTTIYSSRVRLKEGPHVEAAIRAGSYIVEFDMPAYPGLYLSFRVAFPYQALGLGAFHKQLAATTNNTGNFTSSLGYLIIGC